MKKSELRKIIKEIFKEHFNNSKILKEQLSSACLELQSADMNLWAGCEVKCENPMMPNTDPCMPYCPCYEGSPDQEHTSTSTSIPIPVKPQPRRIQGMPKPIRSTKISKGRRIRTRK